MEALPINTPTKDKVVIVGQREMKKEVKLHGTVRPHKGHKLFELNLKTKEVKEAEFEQLDYDVKQKTSGKRKKVLMKESCIYISALNEKNALKKLFKSINK